MLIVFALKKPLVGRVLTVLALKNPGRVDRVRSQKPWWGLVLPCSLSKTRVGGLCCRVRSQKPWWGFVLTVFALKNPGRGFMLVVFSIKNTGRGFYVERVRSQKSW